MGDTSRLLHWITRQIPGSVGYSPVSDLQPFAQNIRSVRDQEVSAIKTQPLDVRDTRDMYNASTLRSYFDFRRHAISRIRCCRCNKFSNQIQ